MQYAKGYSDNVLITIAGLAFYKSTREVSNQALRGIKINTKDLIISLLADDILFNYLISVMKSIEALNNYTNIHGSELMLLKYLLILVLLKTMIIFLMDYHKLKHS